MSNRDPYSDSAGVGLFFLSLERQRGKTRRHGRRDETEREGGWQGVRESAVSAKRGCFMFGAKPAQSETPVRAAAERRPPGRGGVERRRGATYVFVYIFFQRNRKRIGEVGSE